MSELNEKVVLITGAGLGFGRKLAVEFASRGAVIAANDLTPVNLDEVLAEITVIGGRAKSYLADIAKKIAIQTMVTDVLEDWERIDILVNHANVNPNIPLIDMDEWDWRRTMEVNLTGTFLMLQSVGRVMRELGGGTIINTISETSANQTKGSSGAHQSALEGVKELTRQAAQEFEEHNIRVNAVCVGRVSYESAAQEMLKLCLDEDTHTGQILNCV